MIQFTKARTDQIVGQVDVPDEDAISTIIELIVKIKITAIYRLRNLKECSVLDTYGNSYFIYF